MKPKNIVVDSNGKILEEFSSDEVKKIGQSFLDDESTVLAVISMRKNGDMAMNVFGPPSRKVYNALLQALESYDKALKANGK